MRNAIAVAVLACLLGGCAFVDKISQGIKCNESTSAFMDGSGRVVVLKRPRDCAYWMKP